VQMRLEFGTAALASTNSYEPTSATKVDSLSSAVGSGLAGRAGEDEHLKVE